MSFSGQVKTALAAIVPDDECCARSQLFAMLMFSSLFTADKIVFSSENDEAAYLFSGLLLRCFDISSSPDIFEGSSAGAAKFRTTITGDDCRKIHSEVCESGATTDGKRLFACPKCEAAFFRGAFLSCGYVNPPEKMYDIEFSVSSADSAVGLAMMLSARFGMPKLSARKGNQIVYYRLCEPVADLLAYMGAKKPAFEIMDRQVYRSIRNEQNRQTNFDMANLSKLAAASAAQTEAVEALMKNGKFELLSPKLKKTARLRLDNPEASLSELGELESPPVSKSQESKRLQMITEFYLSHAKD